MSSTATHGERSALVVRGAVRAVERGIDNSTGMHCVSFTLDGATSQDADAPKAPAGPVPSAAVQAAASHILRTQVRTLNRPNLVTLKLTDEWAVSTSFVGIGDEISVSKFEVDPAAAGSGGLLALTAGSATEIQVIRRKVVNITCRNVGRLEVLDLTDREQFEARHQHALAPPTSFGERNTFSRVDAYYDVIRGQGKTINGELAFLQGQIGHRSSLLDFGCGSGLFAFALRNMGIYPVCVDFSPTMQRRFEEKNHFIAQTEGVGLFGGSTDIGSSSFTERKGLSHRRATGGSYGLDFKLADMANFSLAHKDRDGNAAFVDFECVICMDAISMLPTLDDVAKAISNISLHLCRGGVAVITLPNSGSVLKKGAFITTTEYPIDKHALGAGAIACAPQGTLHLTEAVCLVTEDPATGRAKDVPTRTTKWRGTAYHPRAPTPDSLFVSFEETFTELLIQAGFLEDQFAQNGLRVVSLFGSNTGDAFEPDRSPVRFYVLSKM
jgi:SAM-dependent methyltransferase